MLKELEEDNEDTRKTKKKKKVKKGERKPVVKEAEKRRGKKIRQE